MVLGSLISLPSAAETGARLYRARCAPCHGNKGEGKRSIKAPSLVSKEAQAQGLSDEKIRDLIRHRANGEMERKQAHTALKKRLTDDQILRIIAHIRMLQANQQ